VSERSPRDSRLPGILRAFNGIEETLQGRIYGLGGGGSRRPQIRAVGIGGGGCNAISGAPFDTIAVCTAGDDARLERKIPRVLLTEEQLDFLRNTSFRVIRSISYDLKDRFRALLGEPDIVFIFAGLGGDTGSYLTPVIADVCKKKSALTVSSVTLPFSVEGSDRKDLARRALSSIREVSDLTITYPNDPLLKLVPNLPLRKAFGVMNTIMMDPPIYLGKSLTLEDLETLRKKFGSRCFRLGVGIGAGDQREIRAVEEAFSSPWFNFPLEMVSSAILLVSSASVREEMIQNVLREVSYRIPSARLAFSGIEDVSLGEKVKVMLILGMD